MHVYRVPIGAAPSGATSGMTDRTPEDDRRQSDVTMNVIFWIIMFAVFLGLWAFAELR